jgi:RHS repeat-associated protein
VVRGPTDTTTLLDGFGRPRGTWNAVNVRTAITYDADGRQAFVSHPYPHGGTSSAGDTFTYDALNRVTSVTHADSSGVTYAYTHDSSYDTVTITDELNHATEQRWEAFGSPDDRVLVGVTDAASGVWAYSYNTLGSLTALDAPGSADRSWTYTAQNWLAQEVHPESGTVDYAEHDGMGRVTRKEVGGTGVTLTYGYDGNGRLTSINAPGSAHDATFTYDDADNRTSVVNGTVSTTITYDAANRPEVRTEMIDGETFVTQYGYDGRDNLTSTTYPSGRIVEQTYDAADRLLSVIGPYGAPVWAESFSYHDSGAIAGYTSGNGQTTSLTLDTRLRPYQLTSGPLSLGYAHDAVGNVTGIDDSRSGFDQGFGYDALDRLTSVTGFAATTYGYDARGNRTSHNSTTYTYNGNERLTSDGVVSYTYDGVGNTLTAGAQTYTYTPLNQVATALVGGATTTYGYDGDNQRRLRVRPNGWKDYFVSGPGLVPLAEYRKAPGGSRVLVREYIYAGDRLIASVGLDPSPLASVTWTDDPIVAGVTEVKAVHLTELRTAINAARTAHGLSAATWTDATVTADVTVIQAVHINELRTAIAAVYTAAGVTPPTFTDPTLTVGVTAVKAVHLQELRAARVNAPTSEVTATSFYHLDALGSVRAVTNATGATVRRHDYAPFGEEPAPASEDTRRFTGKERDAETGLDYFSARYYSSGIGRFSTSDPDHVGGDIFDPQSWNAYTYARNNPLRFADPSGTEYFVSVEGGKSFWFGGSFDAFGAFASGFSLQGDASGGIILDATGKRVGAYKYFTPFSQMIFEAGRRAEPVVGVASAVLTTYGAIFAAVPTALISCAASGAECSAGGTAMAMVPVGRFWKALKPFRGKLKTNGASGGARRYFEWDHTHGDVEVYNAQGRHLGSANPETGVLTKPPVPGRTKNVR